MTNNLKFSIGDVVKVKKYGSRHYNQQKAAKEYFPNKHLNLENRIVNNNYHYCDSNFRDLEWKIIDIAYVNESRYHFWLRTRQFEDLIFCGDSYTRNEDDLYLVRKGKQKITLNKEKK